MRKEKGDGVSRAYIPPPVDAGHIEFLKKAKSQGDYLLVGVHEDQVSRVIS